MAKPIFPRARSAFVKFFAKPHAFEFIAAWFASFGGTANAIRAFNAPEYQETISGFWVAWLWALAAGGGLLFTVCKVIATSLSKDDKSTDGLIGALTMLWGSMKARHRGVPNPRLRLTIFQLVGNDQLEQVLDYVGDARGGGKMGRRFNSRTGVIGNAIRTHQPVVGNRETDDFEAYVRELVRDWSYMESEARSLSKETRSMLAVPLRESDVSPVMGVLYIDSVVPGFFTRRQQIAVYYAAITIASYASEQYK